ncbi:GNAT family N-acetyltransferase [Longirhabdus pacifica]|uniref:GNAT family N-acetyltransferase n=1 Tax=Longirhabdus pacifica TaxID=2305227 RepID=UPI0013E8A020|nr:GNAT family N-acetyltransferase [Longirhabdus pacifica]
MSIHFKTFSELSLAQATELYNAGFTGYVVDIHLTVQGLIERLHTVCICPERSLVAFDEYQPVGFILNAFKTINGKKIVWNGGTAVIPTYRGKKVGHQLMEKTMQLYEQEQVDVATLEAISGNKAAISLYKKFEYDVVDKALFLSYPGKGMGSQKPSHYHDYTLERGMTLNAKLLSFYGYDVTWQTYGEHIRDGESIIAYKEGAAVGYALYKEVYKGSTLEQILLYQCQVHPDHKHNADIIVDALLTAVFESSSLSYTCKSINLLASNEEAVTWMHNQGAKLQISQVMMKKVM